MGGYFEKEVLEWIESWYISHDTWISFIGARLQDYRESWMRIVNTIGKIYDISAAIIDGRLHPESADWVIFRGLSSPTIPFPPASRFFFLLSFPLLFSVSGEKNGFSFVRRGEGRQIELEICDSAVCKVFRFVSDSSSPFSFRNVSFSLLSSWTTGSKLEEECFEG